MTHIEEMKENLARIERTLSLGGWNEGYVKNLERDKIFYTKLVAELEDGLIPIGTKFETRGKNKRLCTVVDTVFMYNNANELVDIRYTTTHEFLGQTVKTHNVCKTTIKMGLIV